MKPGSRSWVYGFSILALVTPPLWAASEDPPTATAEAKRPKKAAVIGPEDAVTILALDAEEISKTWRINSSGELNLPMIGKIQAGGMTVEELERDIAHRLNAYLYVPQVSVYVSEFRSQPVAVTGAVEKPGTYQLEGGKTLFEVLMLAGGLKNPGPLVTLSRPKERGRIELGRVRESEDKKNWIAELDTSEIIRGHGPPARMEIRPDDLIAVSEKEAKFVHILGEVNRPGAVELVTHDTVSLTKLLAAAGGVSPVASPKHTVIRRIGRDGLRPEIAMVDLSQIMEGKTYDLELSAGDVVIVPTNQFRSYLRTAYSAVVNSGIYTGLTVLARF